MKNSRILLVDDDALIRKFVRANLEARGFEVLLAADGDESLKMIEKELPDLIILDIMMPKMDGFEVCRHVREWSSIPIIMLSARDSENDKVRCLDFGADDYLTKPFSLKELLSRIKAVLRRSQASGQTSVPPRFVSGDLEVDLANNQVCLKGAEVCLTGIEYKILACLAANAGRVITNELLSEKVWGEQYHKDNQMLHVNMCRLRGKLKDTARNSKYILTKAGIGYELRNPNY